MKVHGSLGAESFSKSVANHLGAVLVAWLVLEALLLLSSKFRGSDILGSRTFGSTASEAAYRLSPLIRADIRKVQLRSASFRKRRAPLPIPSESRSRNSHSRAYVPLPFPYQSRKLQRRVLRQIASPIQHSITQHNITPQQDTPQQDPPQHHTPQQDIHRSKTPHLQTGVLYSYYILNYFLAGGRIGAL